MEKRWLISVVIAAASLNACGSDNDSVPQEPETVPFCETTNCPKGTTCNEELRMCVSDAVPVEKDNPCDQCTEEQECIDNACVDKEQEQVINPCDLCTEEQECVDNTCIDKVPEPPMKLCNEEDKPTCNGNAVISCEDGQFVPMDCGELECIAGECVEQEVDPSICDPATFEPACDQNGVVSCVEGKLHTEACPDDQNCNAGICVDKDLCPDNAEKAVPGICGCAMPDLDLDENGKVDCQDIEDLCPDDPSKTTPGQCGCGAAEGSCDETDLCPENASKSTPGVCGCESEDIDTDGDGIPDCIDKCPANPYKFLDDGCSCELVKVSIDSQDYCAIPVATAKQFVDMINGIADETVEVTSESVYAIVRSINLGDELTKETEWKPVTFMGKLTSGGNTTKTISYINSEGDRQSLHCAATDESCGLFGKLTGARIHNIDLNYGISGTKTLGGLAGIAEGETKITQINAKTDITGSGNNIGGVIGMGSHTTLSGITHQGKVTNIGANTAEAPIANTGGIAGKLMDASVISDSKNTGHIVSESENIKAPANYLGGLIGLAESGTTLFDLTNDGIVSSQTTIYVGGIAGAHSKISVSGNKNLINNGYIKGYQNVGGLFGALSDVAGAEGITDSVNNGTVVGLWTNTGGITGSTAIPLTRVINHGTISGSTYVGGISGTQGDSANYALNDATIWAENAAQGCGTFIGGLFGQINGGYAHSYLTNHGQIKADWAPRLAVDSSTGVQNADDCPNRYFAGIAGYISDGRGTKISYAINTGDLTTSMPGLGRSGGIAGWAHTLSLYNVKNTGKIKGSALSGGIVGRLLIRGKAADKNFPFEVINVENTGNILSNGDRTGGIFGDLDLENEAAEYTFDQLVNSGTISSTARRVGGIIGNIRANHKNVTFKNLYNTGDIKGTTLIGGIVGYINSDLEDFWEGESFRYTSTADRTMTFTFDGGYSTGSVTGTGDYLGGLFGYIHLNGISASGYGICPGGTQFTDQCPGNTNIYKRQMELNYHNITTFCNIKNMYATGDITETAAETGSNIGGLFGRVYSRTFIPEYQNKKWVFAQDCKFNQENTSAFKPTNIAKVSIQNAYYLGTITSDHDQTGTLFGRMIQTDSVPADNVYKVEYLKSNNTKSVLTNLYSVATLADKGSAVAGYKDSTSLLTASNIYAWADGNPNKLVWGTNTTLGGYAELTFDESGVAVSDTTKILETFNNVVGSLGLPAWKDATYTLPDGKSVTIPSLDIKPQLETWQPWEGK